MSFLRNKAHKGFPIYTWEELVNYLGEKGAHKVVYAYSRVCYAEYHNCPLVRDAFLHVGGFWFSEQQVMTDRKGVILSGEHTGEKFRDVFSGEKFKFEQKILSFDEYDTAKKLSRERKEPSQASLFKGA
jgi:hypothetical protein